MPSFLIGVLAVAIVGSSSPVIAGPARAGAKHAPIEVVRDENGDPLRTIDGRFRSYNWSGYVLPEYQTKKHYIAAQATWTVPTVTYDGYESWSSSWIGIGGFCENKRCTQTDDTLIQLGTEQDAFSASDTQYYAWYEMLPAAEVPTSLAVNPGDVITASLSCAGACTSPQSWTLSMTNVTTSDSWSDVFIYDSPEASVEVIEEAPYSGGILPLADFGRATFSVTTANSARANFSKGDSIVMEDKQGPHTYESSNVSAPVSTKDGFNACFSPKKTLAKCPKP